MGPSQQIVGWLLSLPAPRSTEVPLQGVAAHQPKARVIRGGGDGVSVESLTFDPSGETLVSGESDGTIRLLDVMTGGELRRFKHTGGVSSVTFSPDGKTLAAGGDAKGVSADLRLFDAAAGTQIRRFEFEGNNDDPITSVTFSPDGKTLASGNIGWMIMIWDRASGKRIARFQGNCPILSVSFSPDGKCLAYGSTAGNFRSI